MTPSETRPRVYLNLFAITANPYEHICQILYILYVTLFRSFLSIPPCNHDRDIFVCTNVPYSLNKYSLLVWGQRQFPLKHTTKKQVHKATHKEGLKAMRRLFLQKTKKPMSLRPDFSPLQWPPNVRDGVPNHRCLKLKYRETFFVQNIRCSCPVVLNILHIAYIYLKILYCPMAGGINDTFPVVLTNHHNSSLRLGVIAQPKQPNGISYLPVAVSRHKFKKLLSNWYQWF